MKSDNWLENKEKIAEDVWLSSRSESGIYLHLLFFYENAFRYRKMGYVGSN